MFLKMKNDTRACRLHLGQATGCRAFLPARLFDGHQATSVREVVLGLLLFFGLERSHLVCVLDDGGVHTVPFENSCPDEEEDGDDGTERRCVAQEGTEIHLLLQSFLSGAVGLLLLLFRSVRLSRSDKPCCLGFL